MTRQDEVLGDAAPPAPGPRPYWNPYLAGVGLGLTLLLSYVVLGAGLGASGAIARTAAVAAHAVLPAPMEANPTLGPWFERGSPLAYYLVFMAGGVLLAGGLSAWSARRVRFSVERGPHITPGKRLLFALGGGLIVGFASRLALGCTSGQGLSGGALLMTGGWVFMLAMFASAFAFAWPVRKEWL